MLLIKTDSLEYRTDKGKEGDIWIDLYCVNKCVNCCSKVWVSKIFFKEVSAKLHLFDQNTAAVIL